MHTHSSTLEMKKKAFTVNGNNIKQAIEIEETFISGNKFQKDHFLVIYDYFSSNLCIQFEPLFECHDLRIEK